MPLTSCPTSRCLLRYRFQRKGPHHDRAGRGRRPQNASIDLERLRARNGFEPVSFQGNVTKFGSRDLTEAAWGRTNLPGVEQQSTLMVARSWLLPAVFDERGEGASRAGAARCVLACRWVQNVLPVDLEHRCSRRIYGRNRSTSHAVSKRTQTR